MENHETQREALPMGIEASGCRPGRADPWGQDLARIREEFPGWFIWHVPRSMGGGTRWCARRLPLLTGAAAPALAQAMAAVEGASAASLILSAAEVPASGPERLPILDRLRAELMTIFPGWDVVYRPLRAGPVEWEAYRLPLLHADKAEELAEYMCAVAQ